MLLSKIFAFLVSISFIFAAFTGRMQAVSDAVLDGAGDAVMLSLTLLGTVGLWSGVGNVLSKAGSNNFSAKAVSPLIKLIFPTAYANNTAVPEICANFAANFLGMGNAALPLGLAAVEKLDELEDKSDLYTFCVLATTPIQLIPATLMALRASCGSDSPGRMIIPVLISSILTTAFGAFVCRAAAALFKKRHG